MEVGELVKPAVSATLDACDGDALTARMRAMWAGVAGGWERHADYADARGAKITEWMLDATDIRTGDRVLELACGAGGPGLAAAARVGRDGTVVLSDFVPEMTAIAAARAAARGLHNVETRVIDAQRIGEPDGGFDVVLCREGLMLMPDPAAAAREMHRVLKPGGRIAVAVWGPRARNPWLATVFDVVSESFGTPLPPPGVPHPFSLDDPQRLALLLLAAGFDELTTEAIDTPYEAASPREWWERTVALAGPLAGKIASQPDQVQRAIADRAKTAIEVFQTASGLTIPGLCLVASARRP